MVNWALSFSLIVYGELFNVNIILLLHISRPFFTALMKRKRIDHAAKVTLVINDMSESRCGSLSVKLSKLEAVLRIFTTA